MCLNLSDNHGRCFYYLRLSITDLCNFNCKYCLPNLSHNKSKKNMSVNEIYNLIDVFVELGLRKVRLTGGEPTIRKDFFDIAKSISSFKKIDSLVLTTNGYNLYKFANLLKDFGFCGVNISLDTLNASKFYSITTRDYIKKVIQSVYYVLENGLNVKINIVLSQFFSLEDFEDFYYILKYKNIIIRFIEQMETKYIKKYFNKYITSNNILEFLKKNNWKQENIKLVTDGPAVLFSNNNYIGKIGLINPYSNLFCFTCNRLRVTSDGNLFLCLFGNKFYSLKKYLKSHKYKNMLKTFLLKKVALKSSSHFLHDKKFGILNNFASIGG